MQLRFVLTLAWALAATGCSAVSTPLERTTPAHPIRFLLTFDDGPSAAVHDNPTAKVINTLASNPTQPGIKAIFFVQTRWPGAGGSPVGQQLMRQMVTEGHALAIHTGTALGHLNHRTLGTDGLAASLVDAAMDIKAISGESTSLVRPPFWAFDAMTLGVYDRANMAMLLTDLRARDGGPRLFQADPETGGKLRNDLEYFRQRLFAGHIPRVNGIIPVVVTFHDTRPYTAEHLATYLVTLIRTAREMGLTVADPPFYSDHAEILHAAHARASNRATRADLAP